jgi:hypothetical protein
VGHSGVTTSRKKLDGPVRSGLWGLSVDRLDAPSAVTILRFADRSRHTRACVEVATFAFDGEPESIAAQAAADGAMPIATATSLARDLIAKVRSPRAALATGANPATGTPPAV